MHENDFKEKTGLDNPRVVAQALKIEADEHNLLVTLDPKLIECINTENSDEHEVAILCQMFKKIMMPNLNLEALKEARFYVLVELPKEAFRPEVVITCKKKEGLLFGVSEEPVTNLFNMFVPIINDHEVEDDGE